MSPVWGGGGSWLPGFVQDWGCQPSLPLGLGCWVSKVAGFVRLWLAGRVTCHLRETCPWRETALLGAFYPITIAEVSLLSAVVKLRQPRFFG